MAEFGRAKENWFRKFPALPDGVPSLDTFRRVFPRLNPRELQEAFVTWVTEDTDWFTEKAERAGLRSFIMVEAEREVVGQAATVERRYFISSLGADAQQALRAVRCHWQVENSLHWVLDVAFR